MNEYLPLLITGAFIGLFALFFFIAYILFRKKKYDLTSDRKMSDREIIKRLLAYTKPYRGRFIFVLIVMALSTAYDLLSPILVGHIEETIKNDFELSYLFTVVGVYASILIVSLICMYIQAMVLQKIGQKIISEMRRDVFSHIESFSHNQLNSFPVGKLVTRVSNDPNSISYMFTNILVTLAKNFILIFGILGAMLIINYALTLLVLCFVPFLLFFTFVFSKFSRKAHRMVNDSTTDINTFLSENLSGIKITQIFNREKKKMNDFLVKSKNLKKAKLIRMLVFGVFRPLVYMLYITSILFMLYIGGKGYIKDINYLGQTITSGTIVTFYLFITHFFRPIQELAEQFDMLQKSFASAEKVFTILDIVPEIVDADDAQDVESIKGEIEFKDVWFAYKEDNWVLKGVSFHIYPKQTVAFVGSTGSGKSTILSLICRNYDIQKGQILIDGIDIKKIKISTLRSHFGQMLQDVFLFSGTIRSNIVLRNDELTDEEVMEACRYVNADSFINKTEGGLNGEVRERGNNFSAGQRQLISFARTIIHKPSVIILDEATANIDTETELLIQDSLEKMKNIGTMIVVAHRLSTIQHSDNIIVLSKGVIVEQGNHHELLQKKGKYHKLYTLQYSKQQLEGQ